MYVTLIQREEVRITTDYYLNVLIYFFSILRRRGNSDLLQDHEEVKNTIFKNEKMLRLVVAVHT